MKNLTHYEHRELHRKLHRSLDELVADWVRHNGAGSIRSSIMELLEWSYTQTIEPTELED